MDHRQSIHSQSTRSKDSQGFSFSNQTKCASVHFDWWFQCWLSACKFT